MPLTSGTRLSHYEITTLLGKGGMGEVYRAGDTKLERDVAIKVLPADFAEHADRLARFEREAKSLAALNHPNIATLFGFEEDDGTHFLVMELVEGEDLADRIRRGPIPVDEAIPLFVQIAEGLEAAHEKGIIHRDLKPANIKVGSDGRVKILDFGLAKAMEPESAGAGSADLSHSPTMTAAATMQGMVLGTAAYASPEQIRAQQVDRRADIWAFGVCLFEALSGKPPIRGDDVAVTLARTLESEPSWSDLPPNVPVFLRRLLERCLRKDPLQRQRDIGDARLTLTEEADQERGEPARHDSPRPMGVAIVLAALAAALATYFVTRQFTVETTADPEVVRATIDLPPDLWPLHGSQFGVTPSFSPDGRLLALGAADDLYVRELSGREWRSLVMMERPQDPFFTLDGKAVTFYSAGALHRVSASGGGATTIAEGARLSKGASWLSDDTIVTVTNLTAGLVGINVDDSSSTAMTTVRREVGEVEHAQPYVSPSGRTVVFTVATVDGPRVAATRVGSGEHHVLLEGSSPSFTEAGHLIYGLRGGLLSIVFDEDEMRTSGTPTPVQDDVLSIGWGTYDTFFYSLSQTGSLAYLTGGVVPEFGRGRPVWVDRKGNIINPVALDDDKGYVYPRLSPDGTQLSMSLQDVDGRNLWFYDANGAPATSPWQDQGPQRIPLEGLQYVSSWSPAGRLVVWSNFPDPGLYEINVGAVEEPEVVTLEQSWMFPGTWSSDGSFLLYTKVTAEMKGDIWIVGKGSEAREFVSSRNDERAPAFSPDGNFVVFVSDESGGQRELFSCDFPNCSRQKILTNGGGAEPIWSQSGREIYYRRGGELRMLTVDTSGDQIAVQGSEALFEGPFRTSPVGPPNYAVSADGERFLMIERDLDYQTQMELVINFQAEVERLVPVH